MTLSDAEVIRGTFDGFAFFSSTFQGPTGLQRQLRSSKNSGLNTVVIGTSLISISLRSGLFLRSGLNVSFFFLFLISSQAHRREYLNDYSNLDKRLHKKEKVGAHASFIAFEYLSWYATLQEEKKRARTAAAAASSPEPDSS